MAGLPKYLKFKNWRIKENALMCEVQLDPLAAKLFKKIIGFIRINHELFGEALNKHGSEYLIEFFKLCLNEGFLERKGDS